MCSTGGARPGKFSARRRAWPGRWLGPAGREASIFVARHQQSDLLGRPAGQGLRGSAWCATRAGADRQGSRQGKGIEARLCAALLGSVRHGTAVRAALAVREAAAEPPLALSGRGIVC